MTKRLLLVSVIATSFIILRANVPDSTRITYKIPAKIKVNSPFTVPDYKPSSGKSALIDSLQNSIISLSLRGDSLINITQQQEEIITSLKLQLRQFAEENKNIANELENANGDKLQSSHTNSILYIFNVILGIILLIALVWMLGKKKVREPEKPLVNGYSGNGSNTAYSPVPSLDHRLERIEKLGNLRDKGLLTEEEFSLQKQQILAERS